MTDRVRHLTVTLDRDIRDDDVEHITNAIAMLRGVSKVTTRVVTIEAELARMAVRGELRTELHAAVEALVDNTPYSFKPRTK